MFTNRVVLITGASAGIGAETAYDFAKLGASLAITGRNKDNLENVAADCTKKSPEKLKPFVIVADLTKEKDVEAIIKGTIEHYKKLDILINNAGVLAAGTIETTSLEQYDFIMNTNVRAQYYLTMLATPYLIESKGNIVNISSLAGIRAFPNCLAYCISKAALDQFTRCVALELAAKGVRVNSVNPGVIFTGMHLKGTMTEKEYEAFMEKCKTTHPFGRVGKVEEVTATVVFLAGDGATNITGVTLSVDGGRHAVCPR